jgi:hypothetical protein
VKLNPSKKRRGSLLHPITVFILFPKWMIQGGFQIFLFMKRTLYRSSYTLLEKGWNTNGNKILYVVFPFVKSLGTVTTETPL